MKTFFWIILLASFAVATVKADVIDDIAPMITMRGDSVIYIQVYDAVTSAVDPGATATDNYTPKVDVTVSGTFYPTVKNGKATQIGKFSIIYTATDQSGNFSSKKRTIVVSDTLVDFSLKGSNSIQVCQEQPYTDSGYSAPQNWSSEYAWVVMEGSVNTAVQGSYRIRYRAVDSLGNVGYSDWRTISVVDCTSGVMQNRQDELSLVLFPNPSTGTVYLKSTGAGVNDIRADIFDIYGRRLNRITLKSKSVNSIDLSGYPGGCYFLKVIVGDMSRTEKVIIERN